MRSQGSLAVAAAPLTVAAALLAAFSLSLAAQAGDKEEFNRLKNRSHKELAAGKYAEAERTTKRMLDLARGPLGVDRTYEATASLGLGLACARQARYAEAETFYRRSLEITERKLGPDHPQTAGTLGNLALLYMSQARFAEAEPLLKRAIDIAERNLGPDHPQTAASLNNLAGVYENQARYAEAETLARRALRIREQKLGRDDPHTATSLNNLAELYKKQGRYAEAAPLSRRALEIRMKKLGPDHPLTAASLNNLGGLYESQGRHAEAVPLAKRALEVTERSLGPQHPETATRLGNLATLYKRQARYAEAEPLAKRALQILEQKLGPDHPLIAASLNNLAGLYERQGRPAEAVSLSQRALDIRRRGLGPDHPDTANSLRNLAWLYYTQKQYDEAETLADRAVAILDQAGAAPGDRCEAYLARARIAWQQQRKSEAVDDLRQAMALAEQQRVHASGSERERAESFSRFTNAFEQMLAWQLELNDMGQALAAMERGRARSLLDEMQQAGVDLEIGRPRAEREAARRRGRELAERVAQCERELEAFEKNTALSAGEKQAQQGAVQARLGHARRALYAFHRDARSASPVYRQLLSAGGAPPRLSQIQRRLAGKDGLLLVYLLGGKAGYRLAVWPQKAELSELALDAAAAKALEVDEGPLTGRRLSRVLLNEQQTGVIQLLRNPDQAAKAAPKLAVLWELLVPASAREALTGGTIKRLLVVPDGQLALLPFETLVVRPGTPVEYLLDRGPSLQYGPSATVLYNLAERRAAEPPQGREPVLTVGNPTYAPAETQAAATTPSILNALSARARYSTMGGQLMPLPFSAFESQWVADSFGKQGQKALRLEGTQATKMRVKREMEGRRIVHLACHGLADQSLGNFYGALALAPGPSADQDDDGFLTLGEIYQLNLRACELAILSACETNFGPQQTGEGVWALSRGFLVAGARRVVASNWVVDDEAAATLVSHLSASVAAFGKQSGGGDYALALQRAKRAVRREEKWHSPAYWASLVLVGPD